MAAPNPADLPGTIAILGLLIERPDQTVADVKEGLKKRFPGCRFDHTTAHTALLRMSRAGRSSARVRCTYRSPGRIRTQDQYRVTQAGMETFRAWMYAMPTGVPALREALYGRIELCQLEDLPELIRIGREEVLVANDLFSQGKAELSKYLEQNRRRRDPVEQPRREDHLREVRKVLLHVTPEYWSWRSSHFDEIVRHLEDIARRAGLDFEAA
jgi:DNA-binding PadR family transcriptional regulator